MAAFIQFYNRKLDGKLGEALGSDGCQPVDARLSNRSVEREAHERAYRLRNIQRYEGFTILRGSNLRQARAVTAMIPLPDFEKDIDHERS